MATICDELRPLADLIPHSRNYNNHSPQSVSRMAARVRQNAFTAPIIIRPDGTILGGHLRRLGLMQLKSENYAEPEGVAPGWVVPCRVFVGSEVQELAVLAGDNPAAEDIDYSNEALASLLADLQQQGGLEGAGYDDAALDRLIGELAVPDFAPVGEDEQGRLDEKAKVTCPECGHEFSPS